MSRFEEIEQRFVNTTITKFYRVKKANDIFWFEGLGELESFAILFEIEDGNLYELEENNIVKWSGNDDLVRMKINEPMHFKTQRIIQLIGEKEFGGVFIKLENNMVVYHRTFFGSELIVENYDEVFNEKGGLR